MSGRNMRGEKEGGLNFIAKKVENKNEGDGRYCGGWRSFEGWAYNLS